jgi:hypothetical protein
MRPTNRVGRCSRGATSQLRARYGGLAGEAEVEATYQGAAQSKASGTAGEAKNGNKSSWIPEGKQEGQPGDTIGPGPYANGFVIRHTMTTQKHVKTWCIVNVKRWVLKASEVTLGETTYANMSKS